MKFLRTVFRILPVVLILFLSCKKDEPTGPGSGIPTATTAVINGIVTEAGSNLPLDSATVSLTLAKGLSFSTRTIANGTYTFTIDIGDTIGSNGTMTVSKTGYLNGVTAFFVAPGDIYTRNFSLSRDTSTVVNPPSPTSKYASTIAYVGGNLQLAVYGVGGTESAIITFEARDSLGFPITSSVADTIMFSIIGGPVAGGAYVIPNAALTNAAGRASAVINSGTMAGSLQLVASLRRDVDGVIVRSSPVKIIVHGGHPDQAHFSVGANPVNVFGYGYIGGSGNITVLVGDRYGNPVQPGTAVYFTSSHGVITTREGFTSSTGFATVTIFSGNPFTPNGFGRVYARTLGENGVAVQDSVSHLFSGDPIIDSILTSNGPPIVVDSTTQATITFRVRDLNFNPVAGGSTISVELTGGAPAVVSKVSPGNTIPDTQSQSWTSFSVTISKNPDADPTGPPPYPFSLTITVATPGGIFGTRITSSAAIQGEVR